MRPWRGARSRDAEHLHRHSWLLLLPAVLYCLAPVVANRIEPRIFGVPFLIAYVILVTLVTPVIVVAVARLDPLYRANADEPIPSDEGRQ